MTEIEELIEAANKVLKDWHLPPREPTDHHQAKSWQEMMDDRKYRGSGYSK